MKKLLIVGSGDIAERAIPELLKRYKVFALTRDHYRAEQLAAMGVGAIVGDLDVPASLAPLAGLADRVLHLAPPPDRGRTDSRTRNLIDALANGSMLSRIERLVYVSTSGVYGDCGGEWVDEARAVNPQTERAHRRADAERALPDCAVAILRVPGIYAADRLPIERLRRGTPVLRDEEDVYTNHIHADDLASILIAALERGTPGAVYNASDDSELKMGEYFDLVAERSGLPRPPRISREEAQHSIPPMLLSFMSESRRLVNRKMKNELGVVLRYPTVYDGMPASIPALMR